MIACAISAKTYHISVDKRTSSQFRRWDASCEFKVIANRYYQHAAFGDRGDLTPPTSLSRPALLFRTHKR